MLRKSPNTKALAPDHVFTWNHDYSSPLYRVKIPLINVKSETKESKVPASVVEERKNRVEVVIVRVMKTRKVLDHNSLMSEVMKQSLRFAVKPGKTFLNASNVATNSNLLCFVLVFVKKRIESLIEREYIERDKENR